ncbi:unnamed protein product [Toxocara canis]|uniref:Uncharacterized protein n=1 Tax=Toxocara canis TaxID=6265 RepID=A0A3P7H452_TOXCA|nr:unnamed protein product [Toxocara canis]
MSAPVNLLSVAITKKCSVVLEELHRIDLVIIDDEIDKQNWLPDSLREYVLNYNVRFCVDSNIVRVVCFEQMKQFADKFEKRMQQILFGRENCSRELNRSAYNGYLPRCRVLLHMLGKALDISYLANDRLSGWDLLVKVTDRF